jgi:hypothetical protein
MRKKPSSYVKKGLFAASLAIASCAAMAQKASVLEIQLDNQTQKAYTYTVTIPSNEHTAVDAFSAPLSGSVAAGVNLFVSIAANDDTTEVVTAHLRVTDSKTHASVLWEGDVALNIETQQVTYSTSTSNPLLAHPYSFGSKSGSMPSFDLGIWGPF